MPTNVSIHLSIGIPSQVVFYAFMGYGGTFNGGVKCNPNPTIDLDKAGAVSMAVPALEWGTTHRYADADAIVMPGKPDWHRSLRAGATPSASKRLDRNVQNLNVEFVQMNGATHAVKFVVVGSNPLLPGAPAIDALITVGLRKAAGGIQYAVQGEHDGFPNYTLQINAKSVYVWDAVAKGEDPSALGLGMDQDVAIDWTKL